MHEYYSKNAEKLKKDLENYICPVKDELEKETGKTWDELKEEVWTVYRDELMERFPYIGGDKASGTGNLTGAYAFVALGIVLTKRYDVPLERWGWLITTAYTAFFSKIPGFVRKMVPHLLNHPGFVMKMLKKKDRKNAENVKENPKAFITETKEPRDGYDAIYLTRQCPLADFAREYGYMEYMPYICNLDYVMFGSMNVPFYREKTCASGDDCCDFKMKKGAPVLPAWPCHAADPEDPWK